MEVNGEGDNGSDPGNGTNTPDGSPIIKPKTRGKKRKRIESESASESDEGLPENAFEVEKNVIASAVKNNLDDVSVKKILKKVVTNDHVLALVKLREEEESNTEDDKHIPNIITRAKVKELKKVSPKSDPLNLRHLELTPIKHIPVKTRPEVKALIAHELHEDEDDEEYEPTNDDVPSDDDQGLESCSDLDSQPRTPATPGGLQSVSPKVVKDGPFKVPQDVSTPARRKLDMEEEATIALRTRSKLCLSETPIEHIESSFVPPDELPVPVVDDHLWNEFLSECLNPADASRHEDDDETDPEYSVAADPDAHDDDEEALDGSILISKKELNDLVTELFNIMPEAAVDEELANMSDGVLGQGNNQSHPRWDGKREPLSDDECSVKMVDRIVFETRSTMSKGVSKVEPEDAQAEVEEEPELRRRERSDEPVARPSTRAPSNVLSIQIEERSRAAPAPAPPALRARAAPNHCVQVLLDNRTILPEQILILQQQLRQHVQLAASNFLQLAVHPIHWALGPAYKEYLESLSKMVEANPKSVAGVCNLQPALRLCRDWERDVSADTEENKKMVDFVQAQSDRCQRRIASNSFYAGEFHDTLYRTVAASPVFLYPFLLPAMPYRPSASRRFGYTRSEDSLIALGLDQFWDYVDNNPDIYKRPARPHGRHRWGLAHCVDLLVKHMFPWLSHKLLAAHVTNVRRVGDKNNPITKFFASREIDPVRHTLLPFNPTMTLYDQPEHEMPRIWLRYLAKTDKRFKQFLNRRRSVRATIVGEAPIGVEINPAIHIEQPPKNPLPEDFTKKITVNRTNIVPLKEKIFNENLPKTDTENYYKLVETSKGVDLVPIKLPIVTDVPKKLSEINTVNCNATNTVDCNVTPISSTIEVRKDLFELTEDTNLSDHCECCVLLRSICKKQKVITDYFKSNKEKVETCKCRERRCPRISNRLRLLVNRYKRRSECIYKDVMKKLKEIKDKTEKQSEGDSKSDRCNAEDLAIVTAYQIKLTLRSTIAQNLYLKKRINNLFSKFDPDSDDPITLSQNLESAFKVEMVDLYKEFVGFLTAEQAEKIGRFREYFTMNCVEGLVEKVDELVKDADRKATILQQLSELLGGARAPCAICCSLLTRMRGLPRLARYTFELFPHRGSEPHREKPLQPTNVPPTVQECREEQVDDPPTDENGAAIAPDYEADHSSSGEDSETELSLKPIVETATKTEAYVTEVKNIPHSTPYKPEPSDDSSDMSIMIMSEDENIKSEPTEWKREEDKLILEYVVAVNLSPEEKQDKSVMEILEEKQVIEELSQNMPNKSIEELKERISYLLNVLLTCDR